MGKFSRFPILVVHQDQLFSLNGREVRVPACPQSLKTEAGRQRRAALRPSFDARRVCAKREYMIDEPLCVVVKFQAKSATLGGSGNYLAPKRDV